MPQIIFTIDDDGSTEIEVNGATGGECTSLTKDFEDGLGNVTGREFKPEYQANATASTITSQSTQNHRAGRSAQSRR